MREYNKLHLDLMLKKINYFDEKQLLLGSLIGELDELINILKNVDQKWINEAINFWGNLEILYACNLDIQGDDERKWTLNNKEKQIIITNVMGLKNLANLELKKIENLEGIYSEDLESLKTAEIADDKWMICPVCIDAWESISSKKTVECPKCKTILLNSRYGNHIKSST